MKFKVEVHTIRRIARDLCALALALAASLFAQTFTTTSVQGTVFLASGKPAAGAVQISWPAFTTAAGQAVAAGHTALQLGSDGFLSVALTPNQGATPAGLYYTVVYNLSDGSTSTEYWTVPAAAQAAIGQVRSQVMPAAQAVQAVNKSYVDQAVSQIARSQITSGGGTMTGPLYLNGDPSSPTQAASKHYVDTATAGFMPRQGGAFSGAVTAPQLGGLVQVDQFTTSGDFGFRLQACIDHFAGTNGGACDARNFDGPQSFSADINISTANLSLYLPCSTISTARSIVVAPGTRNVTLHGCSSRGASAASGSEGGTVFLYSGSGTLFQIGDPAYLLDTMGFHFDNVVVNITPATSSSAQALAAWRTQEINLSSMYLLGNANQTGITLDGTGNYTGGTFQDMQLVGFQTAFNAIGHQITNAAPTDWLNASTFIRPHIVCPVNNGNPIAGTVGINLAQGDGNTFTGGDIEGCATALHLGPNAQNNTIVGLRTENSISQVIADAGSSYNNWVAGGTMFTGKLTDNGTRNSFMDTFHRSFNSLNGDWFGSQQDNTLTNHYRLGIGTGNERGLLTRYQTDSGYRWTTGLSDGTSGAQFYQVQDELNNVYRLSIGQYNPGQSSTNNQTVVNAAGSGAVVLNGSNNAGTGGVVFGSGGPSSTTVATVDKQGNANFTGTLQVGGTAQSSGTMTVRNNADAEVDYYLWPGHNTEQKGSFTYKDRNGASQWYMVKDASNNWALNSATGGLDSIKAYQSNNSGDTYVNASNSSGVVRINYESGAGAAFNVYGGSSSNLYASFTAANAIKFPGLAASSGKNCLHIDSSGYITNTGVDCSTGGSVNPGATGQIAYYNASGSTLAGLSAVPVSAGGTGAADAAGAIANLGAMPLAGGSLTGALSGTSASFSGNVAAGPSVFPLWNDIRAHADGAWGASVGGWCNGGDDTAAFNRTVSAIEAGASAKMEMILPAGTCRVAGVTIGSNSGDIFGFRLRGQGINYGAPGATTVSTTLLYTGASGGTVLKIENCEWCHVENLTIDGNNLAGRGLYVLSDPNYSGQKSEYSHIVIRNVSQSPYYAADIGGTDCLSGCPTSGDISSNRFSDITLWISPKGQGLHQFGSQTVTNIYERIHFLAPNSVTPNQPLIGFHAEEGDVKLKNCDWITNGQMYDVVLEPFVYSYSEDGGYHEQSSPPAGASTRPPVWSMWGNSAVVNTSGTTVTLQQLNTTPIYGQDFFNIPNDGTGTVHINGVQYTVAAGSVVEPYNSISLTTSAGTQTGVSLSKDNPPYPLTTQPRNISNTSWDWGPAGGTGSVLYMNQQSSIKLDSVWAYGGGTPSITAIIPGGVGAETWTDTNSYLQAIPFSLSGFSGVYHTVLFPISSPALCTDINGTPKNCSTTGSGSVALQTSPSLNNAILTSTNSTGTTFLGNQAIGVGTFESTSASAGASAWGYLNGSTFTQYGSVGYGQLFGASEAASTFGIRAIGSGDACVSTGSECTARVKNSTGDLSLARGGFAINGATVIPHTTTGAGGSGTLVMFGQTCTTAAITPSGAAGGVVTGTCALSTSATGHSGIAAASDGTAQGNVIAQVSVSGTAATVTLTSIAAAAGTAKAYTVTVF